MVQPISAYARHPVNRLSAEDVAASGDAMHFNRLRATASPRLWHPGRWSEPGGQHFSKTHIVFVPHPGHISVGSNQHRSRRGDGTKARELPLAGILSVDLLDPICPRHDVQTARPNEIEQYRSGVVQQSENPQRAIGGGQIGIGPPPAITTAWRNPSVGNITPVSSLPFRSSDLARRFYGESRGSPQAPCAPYVWNGGIELLFLTEASRREQRAASAAKAVRIQRPTV